MPPSSNSNIAWISWERQRRSITLSTLLGARYYELNFNLPRVLRYLICAFRTFFILLRERDSIVIVQNPSLILAFEAALLKPWFKYRLVIDRHTDIYLLGTKQGITYSLLNKVSDFTLRSAELTLVTNPELARVIKHKKGNPRVVPDPIPPLDYVASEDSPREGSFSILFVASWAADEPIDQACLAARALPDTRWYVSGQPRRSHPAFTEPTPNNMARTGHLAEDDFYSLMADVDIVIALTTNPATLVCAGHEALALNKPFITGNSTALQHHFQQAALYCDGSEAGLIRAIVSLRENYVHQLELLATFKKSYLIRWSEDFPQLLSAIHATANPGYTGASNQAKRG